ncbi:hypothetical protein B0H19DRAFT_1063157 [Mycena capillaripes]|nr:hypothetical protein B0H19DRAFT_1063157 [Mycena capillaripes]
MKWEGPYLPYMAGVVLPDRENWKDHGTTVNGRQVWSFPIAPGTAHTALAYLPYMVWSFPIAPGTAHTALAYLLYMCMWDVPSEPNLGVPRCKWGVPQAIVYEGNAPAVDGNALAVMGRTLYAWKLPVLTGMFQTGCHPSHQTSSSNVMVHKKICTVTVIMYSHTCLVNMQVYGTIFDEVQYTLYNKPIIQTLLQATTQGLAWIKYDPVSLYAKAKACKGFLISLLAAQYVQKCMQYYHLFGICDVTPRDVPHQMWEAQIRNMGSPDIHTWASRTLPTVTVVLPTIDGNLSQIYHP